MKAEDKVLAEKVLRHMCVGARIGGIRFGPILQMLIDFTGDREPPTRGQVYINLCSRWFIYDSLPQRLPTCKEDLPELPIDEQLRLLCNVREQDIRDVWLGEIRPHLIFRLQSGQIFFINGYDEDYECWQLGVAMGEPGEVGLVVACPGGDLAIWVPEAFN